MISAFLEWLDHRVGLRQTMDILLLEHIPGGAKWRYVWGSTLSFVFLLQLFTGVLLMTAYSPGSSTAWGSVFYIQYQMDFGWLIRGLHHFGSQTMVVLLAIHMLQVVIAGAQLPPRELNWWLGLALLGVVLGLSLTGYLLPWDQKGFFATRVATNIAGGVPLLGEAIQTVVIGGQEYGSATVSRFFALHVAILPPLLIVLMVVHIFVFRRHGVTYPKHATGEGWFWPEQSFRDLIVCLVIFGIMLFLVLNGHGHAIENPTPVAAADETSLYEYWARAGQRGLGANLDAPADPSKSYEPRPEWYFLFLFQLLKYFKGEEEIIGTLVIPGVVGLVLFVLPLLGFGKMRPLGHIVGVVVVTALISALATLTCLALAADTPAEVPHALLTRLGWGVAPALGGVLLFFLALTALLRPGGFRTAVATVGMVVLAVLLVATGGLMYAAVTDQVPAPVREFVQKQIAEQERENPDRGKAFQEELKRAEDFQLASAKNGAQARRSVQLAAQGIPASGAFLLLQRDPQTQFKTLFLKNCASCHSYGDFRVPGKEQPEFQTSQEQGFVKGQFFASDLAGFGSEDWIYHFLLDPGGKRFLGRSLDRDGQPHFTRMAKWSKRQQKGKDAKELAELKADFQKIAGWLATHPEGPPAQQSEGFKLFKEKYDCVSCHRFESSQGDAPDLTGYASASWLRKMLQAPNHPHLYGKNNHMPIFRDTKQPGWDLEKAEFEAFLTLNEVIAKKTADATPEGGSKAKNVPQQEEKTGLNYADISALDRELLLRFFTHDYRVVFGGDPISGPPKKE